MMYGKPPSVKISSLHFEKMSNIEDAYYLVVSIKKEELEIHIFNVFIKDKSMFSGWASKYTNSTHIKWEPTKQYTSLGRKLAFMRDDKLCIYFDSTKPKMTSLTYEFGKKLINETTISLKHR